MDVYQIMSGVTIDLKQQTGHVFDLNKFVFEKTDQYRRISNECTENYCVFSKLLSYVTYNAIQLLADSGASRM